MAQLFENNAYSTLASGITAVDTTLTLATGEGARFPSPTGGDFFLATLIGGFPYEDTWEIVKVTARSGDVLTVERAQEGTAALAWSADTKVEQRLTAGQVLNFQAAYDWGDHGAVDYFVQGDASLGVGTAAPQKPLHVQGAAVTTFPSIGALDLAVIEDAAGPNLTFVKGADSNSTIKFFTEGETYPDAAIQSASDTLTADNNAGLNFYTGNDLANVAFRMRAGPNIDIMQSDANTGRLTFWSPDEVNTAYLGLTWDRHLRIATPLANDTGLQFLTKGVEHMHLDADGCLWLTNDTTGGSFGGGSQIKFRQRTSGWGGTVEWLDAGENVQIQMSKDTDHNLLIRTGATPAENWRFDYVSGAIQTSKGRLQVGGHIYSTITPNSTDWFRISLLDAANGGQYHEFLLVNEAQHVAFHVKHYKTTGGSWDGNGGGILEVSVFGSYNYGYAHPYDWRMNDPATANNPSEVSIRFPNGNSTTQGWRKIVLNDWTCTPGVGQASDAHTSMAIINIGSAVNGGEYYSLGNGTGNGWTYSYMKMFPTSNDCVLMDFDGNWFGSVLTLNG